MQNNIDKLDKIFSAEDSTERLTKAKRILQILQTHGINPANASCLEIGTGSGVMSDYFAEQFGIFVSIDKFDIRSNKPSNFDFRLMDSASLDFPGTSFDIVLFSHVYQYLANKESTLAEISRVMKPQAVCYFSTTNRFALLEPHYRLPLLGYFPRMLASSYLKFCSRKYTEYDIYSDHYMGLKKNLAASFDITDITLDLIKQHQRYNFSDLPSVRLAAKCPLFILAMLNCTIMPNWIFLLRKHHVRN